MHSHWAHGVAYYRCRFAAEYAIANHVEHPLNVNIREADLVGRVDRWLAREFAPHRLFETIGDLAAAQRAETAPDDDSGEIARQIADCDRKLARYRAALDAGASPVTVSAWIAETEAERARCEAVLNHVASTARKPMTQAEIKSIVDKLASVARVLADADPNDKSEIFRQLGLKLTCHPGRGILKAQAQPVESAADLIIQLSHRHFPFCVLYGCGTFYVPAARPSGKPEQ